MLQTCSDVNLGEKPFGAEYRCELGEENLDRDFSSVAKIFGEVDCCHSALAELALDAVSIGEGGGEAFGCSHWAPVQE